MGFHTIRVIGSSETIEFNEGHGQLGLSHLLLVDNPVIYWSER